MLDKSIRDIFNKVHNHIIVVLINITQIRMLDKSIRDIFNKVHNHIIVAVGQYLTDTVTKTKVFVI